MTDSICSLDDCEQDLYARGWCALHYDRWYRRGSPHWRPKTVEERFWDKVDASGDCWEWTGTINPNGYGGFKLPKEGTSLVHRVAWTWLVGPIPDHLEIDHLCRVRHCVNPDHMELVTHRENLLRSNGIIAANAQKTHCKHGHPFEGDNLHVRPDGRRVCRACRRASRRRSKAKRKASQ